MKRVVITAAGAISPLGAGVGALAQGLEQGASAVTSAPELAEVGGLRCGVKAAVGEVDEKSIPRKFRRSMSRLSIFATLAAREALETSKLDSRDIGVCIGSTIGSPDTCAEVFRQYIVDKSLEQMKSTLFFQLMGHSAAANVAQAFDLTGRAVAPSSACSTGCQSIGLAAEFIRMGREERFLAGGADELHPLTVGTFDIINAASVGYNDEPAKTPRPFDAARDGVVCGEGAGIVLLEELESARARGATILAEVAGFASICDPASMANPNAEAMARCMEMALADAGVEPGQVDYVNAHATGTPQGDAAEAAAIAGLFGDRVPVSSLKGHLGHTMAASGALELIALLEMMRSGRVYATLNLDEVAPECRGVQHIIGNMSLNIDVAVKNSFAMGGVNCSMVLRSYTDE